MNDFRAKLSIRFFGDDINSVDLQEHAKLFEWEPVANRNDYVSFRVFSGNCKPNDLEMVMDSALDQYESMMSKSTFRGEGIDSIEFFIGVFVTSNCGVMLSRELMEKLSKRGVRVSFDLYSEK